MLTLTTFAQPVIHLDYPDMAFSDIPTRVNLSLNNDTIPNYFLQLRDEGVDTLWIQEDEEAMYIEPIFTPGEVLTFANYETRGDRPSVLPIWMSLLPPLLAIFLALVFKEVIFSLVSGVFVGAAIMGIYAQGFEGLFTGFFRVIDTYILEALVDESHLSVILFSILIGGVVALISKNGGMKGIVNSISRFANNARNGQLATWFLGIAIFFDDYANTLVVGNTMRAVTDKLKISREKLAYIVDSTAAPVSAIAFVTTWIGAELVYINSGVKAINANSEEITEGIYSIFLNSLAYSFYPILTIFFIFYLVYRQKDFGPMLRAERRARKGEVINPENNLGDITELKDMEPNKGTEPHAYNAVIPVAVIVLGTLTGLIFTGMDSISAAILEIDSTAMLRSWGDIWDKIPMLEGNPDTVGRKIGTIIGHSDSYKSLLWSSLGALLTAMVLSMAARTMTLKMCVETTISGFKTMVPALMILILAWALAHVTEDMHTADFLTELVGSKLPPWSIPALTFILSAFVAFSTGSSWSTMALMYPLVLPTAYALCQHPDYHYSVPDTMAIFYNTVSSVLAGAVLGDHCSPISDTTILSSLASGCNHIDHVRTQIPYALTVGGISVVGGVLPTALGLSPWIGMVIGIGAIIAIIEVFGQYSKKRVFDD